MPRVVTGLQKFVSTGSDHAGLRHGARVALVAHPASVDARLHHALDLMTADPALEVVRVFAPEHGLRGEAQDMEGVTDSRDSRSGLPVRSLYGAGPETLRPRPDDLDGLDAVVVDLQDVGSRYYTFVYTLRYVMEAAAAADVAVVVLDRPNPIAGTAVEGPVLQPAMTSFVGMHALPVRHGMTIAELARMFDAEAAIGCDLRIVAMDGWTRATWFDDTGLPWVPPSPNMPTLDTATVYPGACLVEGTNLSEGRGTTRPFEWLGAPWLAAEAWAESMRDAGLVGVDFGAATFRPMFQKHAGESCHGLFLHVTDRDRFRPFRTYLEALGQARRLAPANFSWRTEAYEFETERLAIDLLLGRTDLRAMLEAGAAVSDMEATWATDLEAFAERRRPHLLYPA